MVKRFNTVSNAWWQLDATNVVVSLCATLRHFPPKKSDFPPILNKDNIIHKRNSINANKAF